MWDPSRYNNITYITVPADMIWKPEIVVRNRLVLTDEAVD